MIRPAFRLARPMVLSLLLAGFLAGAIVVTQAGFTVTAFATGLSAGTAMAFAPDGRLFVCEQAGLLEVYAADGSYIGTFHTFTGNISATAERGLLGVAFDPAFAANGHVYVFRTRATPTVRNQVIRLVAAGNVSDGSETVILDLEDLTATNHNGGAIHFGPDGKLYVAQGENGVSANSQLLTNRLGKILRINTNGTIPADNPTAFQGLTGTTSGLNRAIWAVGLRNPYTFAFHPVTGRMFINDVGAASHEEINDGMEGLNYGWAGGTTDGPRGLPGFTDPVYSYGHSGTTPSGVAITGGVFYDPPVPQFPASYVGRYFFSDVGGGWIYGLDPATNTASAFSSGSNQIVDLDVGPDGCLYALDRLSSSVRRIRYTGSSTQAIVLSTDTVSVNEGASATFGVRLAVDPGTTVTVHTGLLLSDATITTSPASLSFTSADFSTYQTVTVSAGQDGDAIFEGGTVTLNSPGLAERTVIVTVLDDDVPVGAPQVRITLPRNGQTLTGNQAEFFGEVTNGMATTQAEFFVDGIPIFTDVGGGHYHVGSGHASWDTTGLANGVHVLRMDVTDGLNTGSHQITVTTDNPVVPPEPPAPPPAGGGGGGGRCGLTGIEGTALLAIWLLRRASRGAGTNR